MKEDGDMSAPMGEGLKEFFNSKERRESAAKVSKVKKECVEIFEKRRERKAGDLRKEKLPW